MLFVFTTSGETGIRTPGPVTVNSFQDCRNRPLCHLSIKTLFRFQWCKYSTLLIFDKIILYFFILLKLMRLFSSRKNYDFTTKNPITTAKIPKSILKSIYEMRTK